jgi:hypothetical protein
MANQAAFTSPNLYELQGGGIHVTYSTSGFGAKQSFSYQDANGSQNFTGDHIKVVETSIGALVTVVIRLTVDSGSTSFSVLLPTVNLTGPGHPAPISTVGITTIHRFSIIPAFNRGQTELYQITPLLGTAEQVLF